MTMGELSKEVVMRKSFGTIVGWGVLLMAGNISAQTLVFPNELRRFMEMTEVQQKEHEQRVMGLKISGSGDITNVEECGLLSKSKLHGRNCYEIVLDKGSPRAVLYVSKTEHNRVIHLSKGREYTFNNCIIRGMRNFGFWSTVYCDLPTQTASRRSISTPKLSYDDPQWKRLIQHDRENQFSRWVYVNPIYQMRRGSVSMIWQLVSFDQAQSLNGVTAIGSQLELWEYDCQMKMQRLKAFIQFNNTMGTGLITDEIYSDDAGWEKIKKWKLKELSHACK